MSAVLVVALVHDGNVLVTHEGRLPEVTVADEEGDDGYRLALERVGADVFLGPVVELADRRYLNVVACRALPVPAGPWLPVQELEGEAGEAVARSIREHHGEPPVLRPAWFRPGWYDAVEAWADEVLGRAGRRRTGVMRVGRVWSLSAVMRIPTESDEVWFKAPCDLFRAEAAIHAVIARHFPDDVPVLLGVDEERGWLLMEEMRGAAAGSRGDGAGLALAARWAEVQLASLGMLDELQAAGGLWRDAESTVTGFRRVLAGAGNTLDDRTRAAVLDVADEAAAMVRQLWACGLPDTLAHGDLHLGNVAWDGTSLRVYDLTDACISHPFLDGCHLALFDDRRDPDRELLAAFVEPWRRAFPDARVDEAIRLAPVANLMFQIDTFDRIRRATEPVSAYELGSVLPWLLGRLPDAVATARS